MYSVNVTIPAKKESDFWSLVGWACVNKDKPVKMYLIVRKLTTLILWSMVYRSIIIKH